MVTYEPDCGVCGKELLLGGWRMWRWRFVQGQYIRDKPFCSRCWIPGCGNLDPQAWYRYDVEWKNYDDAWMHANSNPWVILQSLTSEGNLRRPTGTVAD